MAPQKPANWKELTQDEVGENENPVGKYKAVLRLNRTQGSGQTKQNIRVITNITNGNYDAYTTNFGTGDTLIYSYNASDNTITVANQGIYEQIFTGQNSQQKLNFEKSIKESTIKLAEWNAAAFQTQQKTSELNELKNKPGYKSLANAAAGGGTPPPDGSTGQTPPPGSVPPESIKIDEIESDYIEDEYENLVYPTGLKDYGQDFITFSAIAYGTREFAPSANAYLLTPGLGKRKTKIKIRGSVTLPIQPSITDNNTVQWGGEDLNAISAAFSSLSYAATNNPSQAVSDFITEVENQLKKDSSISPAVRLYLAGKAVGINGLLSRVGGAVLNPNLELLFQGPQLRPFNFNFRLSPRDNNEATQVRKIIRYFKQNMSVKTTADNIFLKAPNVFDIKYVRGKSIDRNGKVINPIDPHPSLNKIKRCALVSCSVDYTPDGTYMTFADTNATMTSYSISLQFQELEPVTERDYKGLDKSTIGY